MEHGSRRNELAERYYPMVIMVARDLAARLPQSVTIDDLIGAGTDGLMRAAGRYDADADPDLFWSYAKLRVRGAMLDYLRTIDVMSRRQRDGINRIQDVSHRFRQKFGHEPTREDLVHLTGLSADNIQELQGLVHVSMPEERAAHHPDQRPSKAQERREAKQLAGVEIEQQLTPEDDLIKRQQWDAIEHVLRQSSERDRKFLDFIFEGI